MIDWISGDSLSSELTLVEGWPEGAATIDVYGIETQKISRPLCIAVQFERYGGTRTRTRFFRDDDDRGRAIFDSAAEAIPPGGDNPARVLRRDVADVESDQTKPAGVQQQIRRLESVFEIAGATNPQQSLEIDSRPRRRARCKHVARVDERAELVVRRCISQR